MNKIVKIVTIFLILTAFLSGNFCLAAKTSLNEILKSESEYTHSTPEKLPYNFESTKYYIIKLYPAEIISTKDDSIDEGEIVKFIVCEDVIIDGKKFLKKGDIINARIEMIADPKGNGVPAEITIDNFNIPNTNGSQLMIDYHEKGPYNWWLLLVRMAAPMPFKFIPFLWFIKGRHAKIDEKDIITIKYYPEW